MTDKKRLLEVRAEKKATNPIFKRHVHHTKPGLSDKWRRPKGLQNKLRLNHRGYGHNVSTGYRSPVAVRDLSKSGKKQTVIANPKELLTIEPETHAIIVARTVGNKKRLDILEEASKHGFEVLNVDVKAHTEKIKASVSARGTQRKERVAKQTAKEKAVAEKEAKAAEKKAAEKEKKTSATDTAKTSEEKVAVKKEQDKVLTKKDQ